MHLRYFDRTDRDGETETIPARAMTAADMQGAKTGYGMLECSHSVCASVNVARAGRITATPPRPSRPMTYDQVLEYTEKLGCSIKTFDEMCSWAHYSPGVAKGGSFTPFKIGGIDRNYSRINQKTIDKSFGSRLLWYTGGTYTPTVETIEMLAEVCSMHITRLFIYLSIIYLSISTVSQCPVVRFHPTDENT